MQQERRVRIGVARTAAPVGGGMHLHAMIGSVADLMCGQTLPA